MTRRLGLIIGVNQYQDSTFHSLQYAENDARALAQWLVHVKGGKWAPPDVQLVQGIHATKELIESLLSQMCLALASSDDLVFVYFAGHAFVDESSGEGYLALSNTLYQEPGTALHLATFTQQLMMRSRASDVLFIIDGFQTGPRWMMQRDSPYDFQPLLHSSSRMIASQQANRLFLCSCRGNVQAPETGERNLGLFMYRSIIGLSGPAMDSSTGTVVLRQLQSFLTHTLPAQQQPQLLGQERSPLTLVGDVALTHPQQSTATPEAPVPSPRSAPMGLNAAYGINEQMAAHSGSSAIATAQKPPQAQKNTSGQLSQPAMEQTQQHYAQLLEQAQYYTRQQQVAEALNTLEQAAQLMPLDVRALILKGQLLGTVGRFQEALSVIEQIIQVEPSNPLAWSMQAVVLANVGQYQEALTAIDRSLALDGSNPETLAIKNNILQTMTRNQDKSSSNRLTTQPEVRRGGLFSFFMGAVMQILGFGVGSAGAILPIVLPRLPHMIASAAEALGLALLCVVAARSAFRYGFLRLLFTFAMCLIPALCLGTAYRFLFHRILAAITDHTALLIPFLFLGAWLVVTASIPLILGMIGFIAGLFFRTRKN